MVAFDDPRLPARFWDKVIPEPNAGCWLWIGAVDSSGYGNLKVEQKNIGAHRHAYESLIGPVPADLEIDHRCRVRCCVNPNHMEPVTHGVNTLRGLSFAAENTLKTHCPACHPLTEDNLRKHDRKRRRVCRACCNARSQRYWSSRRASERATRGVA